VNVSGHRYLQQQVKPCLQKLKTDTDIDVQYYAVEALEGNRVSSQTFFLSCEAFVVRIKVPSIIF